MKVAILEVAYSCNLYCKFCYNPWQATGVQQYYKKKVLSPRDFFTIIDKLKEWGVDNLAFSGGEPLLNKDIFEIARYSKNRGFKNSLLTNGLLCAKLAKEIAENFNVVQISIHGLKETHEELTGVKGSFSRALEGVITLMDYSIAMSAVIVVNRLNLHDLRDTIALVASMDMNSVLINRFLPGGRGLRNARSLSLKKEELVEMLNVVEEACEEYGIPPFVGTPTPPCLEGLRDYKFLLKEGCMAGKGLHCTIDPSGGLKVCNHSPIILGNCLESDPKELYETSEYVRGFKELRYTPKMCEGCPKLEKCKGGCREAAHILFGDIKAPDPIFCL